MLAYFWLLTLTAVLAMVLGGEILIQIGGQRFESAAPLIPLTAGAMSMPRSVSKREPVRESIPTSAGTSSSATILVAVAYIGFMLLLLSGTNLGIYSAPIAMLTAFRSRSVVMFTRSQRRLAAARVPVRRDVAARPWLRRRSRSASTSCTRPGNGRSCR